MRFYDFIQCALLTNQPEWNYYNSDITINPLITPERSPEFIQAYFKNGQKGLAFMDMDENTEASIQHWFEHEGRQPRPECGISLIQLSEYRAIHTVSAFFLGTMLENCLMKDPSGLQILTGDQHFPFSYLWFLTCLYHDYGYIVEENWIPRLSRRSDTASAAEHDAKRGWYYLADVKRRLQITVSPYQKARRPEPPADDRRPPRPLEARLLNYLLEHAPTIRDGLKFECGIWIKGFTYSSLLAANYFDYCIHELPKPVYNHGIIGGYLFFDRMIKNYIYAYKTEHPFVHPNSGQYPGLESFDCHGRHFCSEQLSIFAYIADCIIAHDMWKADESDEDRYLNYGLKRLVGENYQKISFQRNPLLFILAIVDTIEPYKIYCKPTEAGSAALSVWKTIDFIYHGGTLTVKSLNRCFSIQPLYEKAKGLEAWVDIVWVKMNEDGRSFDLKIT